MEYVNQYFSGKRKPQNAKTGDILIVLFMLLALNVAGAVYVIECNTATNKMISELNEEVSLHDEMLETVGDAVTVLERK